VAQSTAIIILLPAGARIARPFSMIGHWPVYHSGTVVSYFATRSRPQWNFPVTASAHSTWQRGPIVTTKPSATAGTVRDMPWLRFTITL
jgi:hypothetical protein